jgi:hypothetical protein
MADAWSSEMGTHEVAWNLAKGVREEFDRLLADAKAKVAVLATPANRNTVTNAAARTAVDAIKKFMRDTKKRYFLTPPLEDVDYTNLKLRIPDKIRTASVIPLAVAKVEGSKMGINPDTKKQGILPADMLNMDLSYVGGDEEEPANRAFYMKYAAVVAGGAPLTNPEEWPDSIVEHSHNFNLQFDKKYHKGTGYFSVRVMNGDLMGEYGPITSADII